MNPRAILLLCLLGFAACERTPTWRDELPRTVLWAWERPEDLRFIDTARIAVAFLAGTLRLSSDRVHTLPRRQPLQVPPDTKLIAVVRIESGRMPGLSAAQRAAALAEDRYLPLPQSGRSGRTKMKSSGCWAVRL